MKNYAWMLALFAALALVFVGCDDTIDDTIIDDPDDATQEDVILTDYELLLEDNPPYGYQGLIEGLFSKAIAAGATYKLSFTFTADRAVSDLQLFLLDNSATATPNAYWTELSTRISGLGFAAEEEVTKTIFFIATASASSGDTDANKIVVACGTGAGGVVNIKFRELKLEKVVIESTANPIVLFDNGTLYDGASLTAGTNDGSKIIATPSGVEFNVEISFDSGIDFTGYTKLVIEWSGVAVNKNTFNLWQPKTLIQFDEQEQAVWHTSTFYTSTNPGTVYFVADEMDWASAWADVTDRTNCTGILISSNYQQNNTNYSQLTAADLTDLVITKLTLE